MSKSVKQSNSGENKGLKPSAPPPVNHPQSIPAKHGHQPSAPPPMPNNPPKKG